MNRISETGCRAKLIVGVRDVSGFRYFFSGFHNCVMGIRNCVPGIQNCLSGFRNCLSGSLTACRSSKTVFRGSRTVCWDPEIFYEAPRLFGRSSGNVFSGF